MKRGISLQSIVPVRATPSERSEQTTQLLFGELFDVVAECGDWLEVCNLRDSYRGYVTAGMVTLLSEAEYEALRPMPCSLVTTPVARVRRESDGTQLLLPMASILYGVQGSAFQLCGTQYTIMDGSCSSSLTCDALRSVALSMLNAPYLWGGKSVMGVDCSGFVQLVYAVCGCSLPRDASQQVHCGEAVHFLSDGVLGDLVFFENAEGRIVHVGMLLDSAHVVHASLQVKVSKIDSYGIIGNNGEYTHKLSVIRRIVC